MMTCCFDCSYLSWTKKSFISIYWVLEMKKAFIRSTKKEDWLLEYKKISRDWSTSMSQHREWYESAKILYAERREKYGNSSLFKNYLGNRLLRD